MRYELTNAQDIVLWTGAIWHDYYSGKSYRNHQISFQDYIVDRFGVTYSLSLGEYFVDGDEESIAWFLLHL